MKVLFFWGCCSSRASHRGLRRQMWECKSDRGGVALSSDADPYVGLGLRLTASTSPLTLQPTFDYVFDEDQTLYHIGGNLLLEVRSPSASSPTLVWA